MNMSRPVVLLHGFASGFDHGWRRFGWPDLLAEQGRDVWQAELLGHGASERPHDPSRYADLAGHVLAQLPDGECDAIGFSAGAATLLRVASAHPERFRRLVLLGLGDGILTQGTGHTSEPTMLIETLSAATLPPHADPTATLFRRMAESGRNDRMALVAFLQGAPRSLPEAALNTVCMPTLVVIGDRDRGVPATRLVGLLLRGELLVVPGLDHFSTPSDFRVVDAALAFIGA